MVTRVNNLFVLRAVLFFVELENTKPNNIKWRNVVTKYLKSKLILGEPVPYLSVSLAMLSH